MLDKKILKKIIVGCIVFAILISIFGAVLLINNLYFSDDSEFKSSETGLVSLNDVSAREEYSSSGMISLNIVKPDGELEDSLELENDLEE